MNTEQDTNRKIDEQTSKSAYRTPSRGDSSGRISDRDQLQIEDDSNSEYEMGERTCDLHPTPKTGVDIQEQETAETQSHRGPI